jgi:hypothetical protein
VSSRLGPCIGNHLVVARGAAFADLNGSSRRRVPGRRLDLAGASA